MSDDSVAIPLGALKDLLDGMESLNIDVVARKAVLHIGPELQLDVTIPEPPAKPKRRRAPRKSGLYAVLHAAQQFGFTPPGEGFWVMLPKEYDAVLALEHKAVAQVVLEVLRQTIGTIVYLPDGRTSHKEWALLSVRHFLRAGITSRSQAEMGIKQALKQRYILRREVGKYRFEYAARWRGTN
jgi:hypothetical protein